MPSFPRYEITHVDLEQPLTPPALAFAKQGNYLVFWWREIPLGHLFIEPNGALSPEQYWAAVVAAVAPAVDHYAAPRGEPQDPWRDWVATGDGASWNSWMTDLLANSLPSVMPRQVPVSVIICTRNRAAFLRKCLRALGALPCLAAEVVVVDNAPSDAATRELVAQEFPQVVYVQEPQVGLDFARNTGIRTAQHPVVVFVDDDVVVHPLLVYQTWKAFQDPATAASTGLVLTQSLDTEAQLIFERFWSFNRGYVAKVYPSAFVTRSAAPVWDIGAGANMAFRKSVFEHVGYFDELLDVGAAGCSGDSEMWHRILVHGYRIRYVPTAVVFHEHRRELAKLKQQLFYYMRGHAAAALIQHEHQPQADYAGHVFRKLPIYYLTLIKGGFPFFRFRSRTLWSELQGLVSGVLFYYRQRRRTPPQQP